jgi:hypothetical protein
MTKEEIAADFKAGRITLDEMTDKLAALAKKPFKLDIGDKGWLKINFDGFRFPVNMSLPQAEELFSEEGVQRVREFIEANRGKFKVKA